MMSSRSATLAIKNMSVKVNGNTLLKPLSLTIEPGTWLGVVGPNGGGKSTLVKTIMGQMPHQGDIALTWPQGELGKIGYVPQLAAFEPSLPTTVMDYLRLVSEHRPVWHRFRRNQAIDNAMKQLQITDFSNKRLGHLSTGEKQRVLLCGALVNQPDMLFLDEPLAGVDQSGFQIISDVLHDFHQSGRTVVMVEHQWQVIERFCSDVALINGGLVAFGSPKEVFQSLYSQSASNMGLAQSA